MIQSANMAVSAGLSSSYTAEVREKLSLWDVKDSPLAPLTDKQRNSVLELTTVAGDRPLLDEVNLQPKHVAQQLFLKNKTKALIWCL